VVGLLAILFFVILAEGIFLAASGFLPESLDQFAQDVVLPAFTPTVGVLLAISTLYGLWKVGAPCLSSNTRSGGGCNTAGGAPVLLWPAHFSVACSLCLLADARCT
jgi:hypothetical protein